MERDLGGGASPRQTVRARLGGAEGRQEWSPQEVTLLAGVSLAGIRYTGAETGVHGKTFRLGKASVRFLGNIQVCAASLHIIV